MHESTTHGIVHAGFRGFRAFVARKKGRCKLIGNRFVIPHDTIPSTVGGNANRTSKNEKAVNKTDKRIPFIGGIHGVGKSTICQQICSELNMEYLSASELLKWEDINDDAKTKKQKTSISLKTD